MDESALAADVFLKVKKVTAEVLRLDEARITPDTRFIEDLGAESLDLVTLVIQFEDEFKSKIPDEDIERLKSVRDAVAYISDLIARREKK